MLNRSLEFISELLGSIEGQPRGQLPVEVYAPALLKTLGSQTAVSRSRTI